MILDFLNEEMFLSQNVKGKASCKRKTPARDQDKRY
jgi:hypothetical protein